jgi:hypothetical protein
MYVLSDVFLELLGFPRLKDLQNHIYCNNCNIAPQDSKLKNMSQYPTIIFLDIDGVLNRHGIPEAEMMVDDETIIDTYHDIHPYLYIPCLENFKNLLEALGPDAKVVISSSWRDDEILVDFLVRNMNTLYGEELMKDRIIGDTNQTHGGNRSNDISAWIHGHVDEKCPLAWIAIDDTEHNVKNLGENNKVLVHDRRGLTEADVESALRKLAEQAKE